MRFWQGLFETKAASPSDAITRATGGSTSALSPLFGGAGGNWDYDKSVHEGYERVIWVFRCVDALATNLSRLPMLVREGDHETGKEVEDKQLQRLLNRRANTYETSQQFRYRLISQLLLSKKGAFIERVNGRDGRAVELHLLPPGRTEPIKDPKRFVKGFKVRTENNMSEYTLAPEQVVWIRAKPHPSDPYLQMTPLVAAGLAADTDWLARVFNRNVLANDGRGGLLIGIHGKMSPTDAAEIKRRFGGGPARAGQNTVIEADSISISDLMANHRDVQWLEAITGSKEDILLSFGVSETFIGNASGRTFDNADAELENTWTTAAVPLEDAVDAGFDVLTSGGLEDDYYVATDYSKVDVLHRAQKERHDKLLNDFLSGGITLNDYLEGTGRETVNMPGANTRWIPAAKLPIANTPDEQINVWKLLEKFGEVNTPPQPAVVGGGVSPDQLSQVARQGALQGAAIAQRRLANIRAADALRLAGKAQRLAIERKELPIIDAEVVDDDSEGELEEKTPNYSIDRNIIEAEVSGVLHAWSNSQERVVLDRLDHVKVRKHTRHWEGEGAGTKALDSSYVVELDRWAAQVRSDMEQVLRPRAEKEARLAAKDMAANGVVDELLKLGKGNPSGKTALDKLTGGGLSNDSVVNQPLHSVLGMIEESAQRQSRRVADTITEMDSQGASLNQIKSQVQKMIGTRSSWKKGLATHATTALLEGVKTAVYGHGGNLVERTWWTVADEKVRKTHWEAEGETVQGGKPFIIGKSLMMFPGDPTAPIDETANCRCWAEWKAK